MKTGNYDGVSASGDATLRLIAGGDVAPVNTDLIENYDAVFEGLKNQPHNTVDGVLVRRPAWPRGEPLDVADRRRQACPGQLERRLGRELAVQGQDHRVRQPDLHRGRGRLPEGDPAGPRHRGSVRARRRAVPGRGRPAEAAEAEHRRVLVGCRQGDPVVHEQGHRRRHDLAVPGQPADRREAPGPGEGDPAEGGLDRLVGHLDDLLQGQEPELHVPLDELHHLAGGEREGDGVLRRGPGQRRGLQPDDGQEPLRDVPRAGRGLLLEGRVLEDADQGLRRRPRRGLQGLLPSGPRPGPRSRAKRAP